VSFSGDSIDVVFIRFTPRFEEDSPLFRRTFIVGTFTLCCSPASTLDGYFMGEGDLKILEGYTSCCYFSSPSLSLYY
jgi:hypothetical protein